MSFVVSINLKRNHRTSSQKPAEAIKILPLPEEEAKKGMSEGEKVRHQGSEQIPYPEEQRARLQSKPLRY